MRISDGPSDGSLSDRAGAALFGAELPRAREYAALLSGSAVEQGLIGPHEASRIWERHVLNCAAVAPALPPSARVADVGSGAGLPGLVLAIARPDVSVCLIEPLLRRATWLQSAIDGLELQNAVVMRSRAEDVPPTARGFDVVTARAVAALPRLLGWCMPLLRPGGVLLALKGETVAAELVEAKRALVELHARAWSVEEFGAEMLPVPTRAARVIAGADATLAGSAAAARRSRSKRR